MKWLPVIIVLLLSCGTTKNAVPSERSAEVFGGKVYLDRFDNVYAINASHEVIKYDDSGKVQFVYSNRVMGDITHLDVSNPQLVIAYVSAFGRVIVLDNTLAELSSKSLVDLGYTDVSMMAVSNDGNYWLYDEANWRLLKVNLEGDIIAESNRLGDFQAEQSECLYMVERGNRVYLSTANGQLLIFDNLGSYMKAIPLPGITKFSVNGQQISYLHQGQVMRYDMKLLGASTDLFDGTLPAVADMDTDSKGRAVFITKEGKLLR